MSNEKCEVMQMGDSGMKAMGSLADLLLDFVSTTRMHDSNYEIANALLAAYPRIGDMTLREMSELCFVSQASFSRFCRFMGFESFSEFKDALGDANYQLADDYRKPFMAQLMESEVEALESYRTLLSESIRATLDPENLRVADELLDEIARARRIVFFSHHFLWDLGRYFQQKMLQMGIYIELFRAYEHQLEAAESLGEGDLAIICSINGSYCSLYNEIAGCIFSSGAKAAVLTQSTHSLFINRADYVLICGPTNENDIGKYTALMTIDFLVMAYMRRQMVRGIDHD